MEQCEPGRMCQPDEELILDVGRKTPRASGQILDPSLELRGKIRIRFTRPSVSRIASQLHMQQSIHSLFAAVPDHHGFRQHGCLSVPAVLDRNRHVWIFGAERERRLALGSLARIRQRLDREDRFPQRLIGQTDLEFHLGPSAKLERASREAVLPGHGPQPVLAIEHKAKVWGLECDAIVRHAYCAGLVGYSAGRDYKKHCRGEQAGQKDHAGYSAKIKLLRHGAFPPFRVSPGRACTRRRVQRLA